jgi:protein O-mannosyl-transferase
MRSVTKTVKKSNALKKGCRFLHLEYYAILLVPFSIIISYFNTFNVPFVFDDLPNIIQNFNTIHINNLLSTSSLFRDNRWIGEISFAFNYYLHGIHVWGYHLVNLLIHLVNSLLVFFLTTVLIKSSPIRTTYSHNKIYLLSLSASLLFAVHPIQTEAVTYIVQRFTSLSALFYLLAVTLYVKFRTIISQNDSCSRRLSHMFCYSASFVATLLAMRTRESCFTLPIVLVFCEILLFGWQKKSLLYLMPFCLTLLIIPGTLLLHHPEILHWSAKVPRMESLPVVGNTPEQANIDAGPIETPSPPKVYLLTQSRVVITYIRLIFFPLGQNLDYDYPLFTSFFEPPVVLSCALLVLITLSVVLLSFHVRNRIPHVRLVLFGLVFFFIALSVESSVIPLADVIFEHRMYLPSVGVIISLVILTEIGVDRIASGFPYRHKALVVFLMSILLIFTFTTVKRNEVWKSQISLWQDVVKKSPGKARGFNNLGLAYMNNHQLNKAIEMLDKAIAINPENALSYHGRGIVWAKANDLNRAHNDFLKARQLDPGSALTNVNMGFLQFLLGKDKEALDYYNQAVRLDSNCYEAYNKRGVSLLRQGNAEAARSDFLRAIDLNPLSFEALNNIGLYFVHTGHFSKAIVWFNQAIAVNVLYADAYNNLGVAQAELGQMNRALDAYNKAIKINPRYSEAYCNRGSVYTGLGLSQRALSDINFSITLTPNYGLAHYNRGRIHLQLNDKEHAIEDFTVACILGLKQACSPQSDTASDRLYPITVR